MVVDSNPKQGFDLDELADDLIYPPDLNDRITSNRDQDNIFTGLDDETLIRRFARGKKRVVSNHNLKIDYAHNSLQLSTPSGDLIGIHKISDKLHYILVKKNSVYSEFIHNIILEYQFIPLDTATSEQGFVRYQKHNIPDGYQLHYAEASDLWRAWEDQQQHFTLGLRLDVLLLAKSKWYRVQDITRSDEHLDLQTRLGKISLHLGDSVAWIDKLEPIPPQNGERAKAIPVHPNGHNSIIDSGLLAKIMTKLAIDADPNSNLRVGHDDIFEPPIPVVNLQPVSSDLERSSMITNKLTPDRERLLTSVLKVLEDYLENGETIVRSEVVSDAQGQTVSEKTITTHRGCPRWVIETILNWD
jgi:hypothetical protein